MLSRQTLPVKSVRCLHTTAITSDFMSWFRKKQDKKQVTPTKNTEDVISEIESGKANAVEEGGKKLKLTEDDFIGEELGAVDRNKREALIQSAPFNQWLSTEKTSTTEKLNSIILASYNKALSSQIEDIKDPALSSPFVSLVSKFKFTKDLQSLSGFMISDYQLTRLTTPLEFREYFTKEVLSGKLARFNDVEPNAIELDDKVFPTNVYISKHPSVRDQKKKFSGILNEVQKLEAEAARRAIEEARNS